MKTHSLQHIVFLLFLAVTSGYAQQTSFREALASLHTLRGAELDTYWETLAHNRQIPLVENDSVAFLYRGNAKSVTWMGDFNGWGYNKNFPNKGKRIPNTDIWILKTSFPVDARLDYKIVINETQWILDPNNPNQQWSGVGGGSPNSELRMPQWHPESIAQRMRNTPQGEVRKDILLDSKHLAYQVMYSIYYPAGYDAENGKVYHPAGYDAENGKVYPVVYVTDGYEYMHEHMGNMITILDNLIHLKKITPVIAVFVDHREPINRANNRRMQELAMNEKYLKFFTEELIPKVEAQVNISKKPEDRAILGTSMGGLAAAYFSFSKPDVFGMAGIQSPAFWFRPEIYTFCDNPDTPPVKTFMTTGLVNDSQEGTQKMINILNKNTCTFQYKEVNQGHSWGNWRDLIDDILIYFFPLK
jgi:enterochelin esterase-like enzyme